MRRDRPQCPGGTRGVPTSTSSTKQLSLPELLAGPHHPARKRIAIERTRTIRVALIPTDAK